MALKLKVKGLYIVPVAAFALGWYLVSEQNFVGTAEFNRSELTSQPIETSELAEDSDKYDEGLSYAHALWFGESFHAYVNEYGPRTFEFVLEESDPNVYGSALDYGESFRFTTSFDVNQVVKGLGPYQWLLSGVSSSGNQVVQKFKVDLPNGSYARPPVFLPPGGTVNTPPYVGTGGYIAQPSRQALGPLQRTALYRGSDLGTHLVVAADPYERYGYIISRDQESLYLLPLGGGDLIFAPTGSNSQYLSDVTLARVQMHETEGLKLKCTLSTDAGSAYGYLMFSDYDGDGLWDSNEFMTQQQYQDFGYPGLWTEDFVRGVSWLLPD
jgi:hypothetical protein